ncbi:MAG: HAMP domain-containing protein [Acidobacteria bacterium]|nr:HAMP domain-containing protein [Acidobacteriota bacterium]
MTLRSPIFRKILLSGFALNAAALLLLDFYLSRYIARHEHEHVRQRLSTAARILADEAATVPLDRLQPWTASASARAQARVTVIDPHGRVLADSGHDPERMENHAGRPEIQAALRGGTGAAVRHSDTLGVDLYYVAAPLVYQNRGGHVLRLALPLSELKAATAEVRKGIVWASAIVAGMALLVAYIFSAHLTRRVRRLQSFAERSHAAGYGERLAPDADDELGDLARSLDRMTAQLRETIEGLNLESARRAAILSSMVEGVLAVDHSLRVTFCNEAFARAFGAALPIPERLPLLSLVRDPALLDMFTRVLVSGDVVKGRLQGFAAGDRSFEVQVTPLAAAARRRSASG